MTRATDILDTQSRSPNPIKLVLEETRRYDCVGLFDANILKAIKEEVSKSEHNMLDVVTRRLDTIDRRIEDVKMHLKT